ncbi:LysR family transcriptional regulator [Halovulum dunhuangense]|uniref:LysR family transcriptional regulator n=1 Tax=Halovulum dunhuangense TaxID=1505036 RepID=A0A849L3F7_9RHOB|nr:LysR family transcriptional regulator [Halovulum dunhuangense]NNU80760.1 LysR family transcriptional regulator [Halovulum dunhuangense]
MADAQWDDLRIFLAVARAESLTGAAKALRLDPATAGRRVGRLEESLDARLFVKSPQGYTLTEAGQRLFEHALRVEEAMRGALSGGVTPADALSGSVRIGAPDGCANYLLPQVCAAICEGNPGLEVQIVALPRVFNLSKREADMAIAVSRPSAGRLTVQKLADYHLHLAAAESYLERHAPIRSLGDLAGHPVVGYIPDMIFDRELDYLSEIGTSRPEYASNSVPVQLNWIRAGAGIGIVHDFALPFAPGVRRLLTGEISLRRSFHLIRHADDRRVERLNLFAEALAQRLRAEVARLESLA